MSIKTGRLGFQIGNRQLAFGNDSWSAILLHEPARGFAHLIGQRFINVITLHNAHDRRFNRHVLIPDGGSGCFAEGAHHHLARPCAQSIGNYNDVTRWLLIEIVRMDNQKPDALQIGRLLGGPNCADYFG